MKKIIVLILLRLLWACSDDNIAEQNIVPQIGGHYFCRYRIPVGQFNEGSIIKCVEVIVDTIFNIEGLKYVKYSVYEPEIKSDSLGIFKEVNISEIKDIIELYDKFIEYTYTKPQKTLIL